MAAKSLLLLVGAAALVSAALGEVYFKEEFTDDSWTEKWVNSKLRDDYGELKLSHGKFYGDEKRDQGLKTSQDARFYATSAKFPKSFNNQGKTTVIQFTVKHEQNIDCGGGYVKVMSSDVDQEKFGGETPYSVMFGPDICGSSTKKVHLILNYKGKNHLLKKNVPAESDTATHLYTLILRSDNTYEIRIDEKEVAKGSLREDWDLLQPKEIKDPNEKKPSDWVDQKEINDPEDKKPEGWDDIPAQIADKDASKPDDWDDELDGEWEAPQIPNPDYKGEWTAKRIPNPEYKGEWVHPMIANPEYVDDEQLYLFKDNAYVAFELWQVKAGTIFDNILVADTVAEAEKFAEETFQKTVKGEKAAKEAEDKKAEEERKKAEAESAKDDEDDSKEDKDEL